MASEYTPPTISNYNDDAPPDDGTETSDNEITWAIIKDELADPIKNYAEAINSAVTTSFTTLGTSDEFDYTNTSGDSMAASTWTQVNWAGANYKLANESGMYQLNANLSVDSIDDGSFLTIAIYVDPLGVGSYALRKMGPLVYNHTGAGSDLRVGMSTIVSLDPTDRVTVYAYHDSALAKTLTTSPSTLCWFNGFRVLGTS